MAVGDGDDLLRRGIEPLFSGVDHHEIVSRAVHFMKFERHGRLFRLVYAAFRVVPCFLLCVLFYVLFGGDPETAETIHGFGMGASLVALFSRVGGGIYTKAADVGADLVGKVEAGIPEDDPRNPATIADNVGDNVGDVAGMGADLFGSCAESTCAALVISAVAFAADPNALLYPILISAVGIPISFITKLLVGVKKEEDVAPALMKLLVISSVLMAIVMYFVTMALIPGSFELGGEMYSNMGVYWCFLSGLVAGLAVGLLTGYYTSEKYKPVQEVAKSCETGVATNIIYGLALGYKSTVLPYLCIAISIFMMRSI